MVAQNSADGIPDHAFVRRVIWELLPEDRITIVDLENEEIESHRNSGEEGGVLDLGVYELGGVFVHESLDRLFSGDRIDGELAQRCARVIECLLGGERPVVSEMISVRVTDYLLGYVTPWIKFKEFAGPLLLREIERRKQYYTGPF